MNKEKIINKTIKREQGKGKERSNIKRRNKEKKKKK
jgi:hypothetical protein